MTYMVNNGCVNNVSVCSPYQQIALTSITL